MSPKNIKRICLIVFLLGIINFAAFFVEALILGGDAVNGKFENGHYYVSNHGHNTEVSREVYEYSRAHARSLWITHPLAILAAVVMTGLDHRGKNSVGG